MPYISLYVPWFSITETVLEARLKKWEKGIDIVVATKEDLEEYIDTKMQQYAKEEFTDDYL